MNIKINTANFTLFLDCSKRLQTVNCNCICSVVSETSLVMIGLVYHGIFTIAPPVICLCMITYINKPLGLKIKDWSHVTAIGYMPGKTSSWHVAN